MLHLFAGLDKKVLTLRSGAVDKKDMTHLSDESHVAEGEDGGFIMCMVSVNLCCVCFG